jgi:serine/threonine protein kinase
MSWTNESNRRIGCLSRSEMQAFHSGRLSLEHLESVADHLAACEACASSLEGMHDDDSVFSKLRRYLPHPAPAVEPECERLSAVARLIPLAPTGAATSTGETQTHAPARAPAAPPPRRIAGYELLAQIGYGGMGVVWRARHGALNRLVALKLLRFGPASGDTEHARFRLEAQALARIHHPNVVEVHDAGEFDGQPYFAMELLEGGNLARRLLAGGRLPPLQAAELTRILALAVQAAHDANVLHRDLKPSNVLFTADGVPKVADFGLAKLLDSAGAQTRAGDMLGTPAYMAPEQARGDQREVGPTTDVYGLGALLYEMLAGRPPFRGRNHKAILHQVVKRAPSPLPALGVEKGRNLAAICERCLEKEPKDRYPSAAALAEDLDLWARNLPPKVKPPGPLSRVGRYVRRRTFLSASIGACGLLALGGTAGWLLWDPNAREAALESQLAGGAPVTLLGDESSSPAWQHWQLGARDSLLSPRSHTDSAFTIHCETFALLELLRSTPLDRYRLRADVRQEKDMEEGTGRVGIYFGGWHRLGTGEGVHVFIQLGFNDIFNWPEVAAAWNRKNPLLKPLAVPTGNPLKMEAHLYSQEPGAVIDMATLLARGEVVDPRGWAARGWRSLAVEVTPEEIRAYWEENTSQPTLRVRPGEIEQVLLGDLNAGLRQAYPKDARLAFAPKGSLGLLVAQGAASFRNVRVEPLDPDQ